MPMHNIFQLWDIVEISMLSQFCYCRYCKIRVLIFICISLFYYAIQVGGLGDVVTSLSRAIQDLNHNVDIVLPKYDCLNLSNVSFISI